MRSQFFSAKPAASCPCGGKPGCQVPLPSPGSVSQAETVSSAAPAACGKGRAAACGENRRPLPQSSGSVSARVLPRQDPSRCASLPALVNNGNAWHLLTGVIKKKKGRAGKLVLLPLGFVLEASWLRPYVRLLRNDKGASLLATPALLRWCVAVGFGPTSPQGMPRCGAGTSDPGLVEAIRPRGRFGLARWFSHKTCGSWLLGWGWLTLCRPRGSAGGRVCVCVCVLPSSQPRYRPPGPSRSTGSPGGAEPVPGVPAAGLQLPSAPAAAHAPALPFAPQQPPFEP